MKSTQTQIRLCQPAIHFLQSCCHQKIAGVRSLEKFYDGAHHDSVALHPVVLPLAHVAAGAGQMVVPIASDVVRQVVEDDDTVAVLGAVDEVADVEDLAVDELTSVPVPGVVQKFSVVLEVPVGVELLTMSGTFTT